MKHYRIEKWNTKDEPKCIGDYGGGYTDEDVKNAVRGYRKTDKIGDVQFYQRKGSFTLWMVTEE